LNDLLTLVLVYGYPVVGATVLVSSLGVPLPVLPILLVAGSMAAVESLDLVGLIVVVTACSVAGDVLGYWVGRLVGETVLQQLAQRSPWTGRSRLTLQRYFTRWSGLSIFLTRWLLTPFGSLTNLVAGLSNYPLHRFLLFDLAGEAIGAVLFLGLGYLFGVNWRTLWEDVDGLPGVLTVGALGLILLAIGLRRLAGQRRASSKC
jgi:membrane protein DedA with SNARE-associated domain